MTEREALKLALEALEELNKLSIGEHAIYLPAEIDTAMDAIREALAQPEFTKHEVVSAEDWSEWVCPDPKSYLMKCCDCGLVHEAQFKVVRYKSEDEREECDPVNDPNLQAVFRMRRSEEWTPEDTAYRPGGLAQPEQEPSCAECGAGGGHALYCVACAEKFVGGYKEQEPVAWMHNHIKGNVIAHRPADIDRHPEHWTALYLEPKPCPTCEALARTVMLDQTSHDTTPPQTNAYDNMLKAIDSMRPAARVIKDKPATWWLDEFEKVVRNLKENNT